MANAKPRATWASMDVKTLYEHYSLLNDDDAASVDLNNLYDMLPATMRNKFSLKQVKDKVHNIRARMNLWKAEKKSPGPCLIFFDAYYRNVSLIYILVSFR
jgi:hypothetical protein